MKKTLPLLLFVLNASMTAQTTPNAETVVTPNGKKVKVYTNPLVTADNGLTNNNENVQLGGTLNKATTLTTTSINTLAIQGLQSGSPTDQLITADNNGVLHKISNNNWSLNGNKGTSKSNNFLGTTDNVDLVFRRSNVISGLLGVTNTSFGYSALTATSPGNFNTAIGVSVLPVNTGNYNVGIGYNTLLANTSGSSNIGMGYQSLEKNTTGSSNLSLGQYTLSQNTSGSKNIGIGEQAIYSNTIGNNNIATGDNALYWNTTGNYNAGFGCSAMTGNQTGSYNVAIGYRSGANIGGTNNLAQKNNSSVFIGGNTSPANDNETNQVVIGYNAIGRGSNTVQIGNSSMASIGGAVNWSIGSDVRLKKDIENSPFGLNFITKLRPVTYHMKTGTTDLQSGFIAQEVETAANSINYQFNGIVKPQSQNDFYSLRYSEFVVPLVKAVQEQQKQIEEQQKQIKEKDAKIADFENRLLKLEQKVK